MKLLQQIIQNFKKKIKSMIVQLNDEWKRKIILNNFLFFINKIYN